MTHCTENMYIGRFCRFGPRLAVQGTVPSLPLFLYTQGSKSFLQENCINFLKRLMMLVIVHVLWSRCLSFCDQIQCKDVVLEDPDIAKALIGHVSSNGIEHLVMGASSSRSGLLRYMIGPPSRLRILETNFSCRQNSLDQVLFHCHGLVFLSKDSRTVTSRAL